MQAVNLNESENELKNVFSRSQFVVEPMDTKHLEHAYQASNQTTRAYKNIRNANVEIVRSDQFKMDVSALSRMGTSVNMSKLIIGSGFGIKLFKLLPNWLYMKKANKTGLMSCGGAWSNHIDALGQLGRDLKCETFGLIRGERNSVLTPTLLDAKDNGMKLHFINRNHYKVISSKRCDDGFMNAIVGDYARKFHWIPMGGSNGLGVVGSKVYGEIVSRSLEKKVDELWVSCGTGSTLLGLASGVYEGRGNVERTVGVNVLSNSEIQKSQQTLYRQCIENKLSLLEWEQFLSKTSLIDGAQGGYAKATDHFKRFYEALTASSSVAVDPVYVAKTLYRLCIELEKQDSKSNSAKRIAVLHTGGVQGARGYNFPLNKIKVAA
jgi:1-aminocyclopropane-1-carboxylate deaminase/D-cysteine desulfhydrase-like pyridoxal-dependent ACC family enzyme